MEAGLPHLCIQKGHTGAGQGPLLLMTVPSGPAHAALNMTDIGVERLVEPPRLLQCQAHLEMVHQRLE